MINQKLNLVLFFLALTITTPLHLPRVIAETTQVQNNSNENWEKAFEDFFNQSDEDPPVKQKEGTSRGGLCLVSPGLIEVEGKIWNTRPIFIWQGPLNTIEIHPSNNKEVLWTFDIQENEEIVDYTGEELEPGNTYRWRIFDSTGSIAGMQQRTFSIMDVEEHEAITQDLAKLDLDLNKQGATEEAIALARVKFFAERNLWSDALSEVFKVKKPSIELQTFRSNILQRLCEGEQN
ncbi:MULTISPECIES: DUF928 domain-containing protein [Okeania]|uniref:DUF928 domain-containing protein n=1 Tax=Okeania hirsuta TaxID=1458930 RepID=A0A3N6NT56_9CYAN|nr:MULTISPECIES: DUF928 domain-containing protein [Okeania]NES88508.1 DUF928 domain-containing protein [Okeania sp. SIO2B9]NET74551.1 DUF928 domain-containing protein [Okeania sp. SIO1F9]RQH21758.1 DUF928 domain-containing protein [Okeania hirsuta]RQH45946.1 DUF928 domain-containing protein [Okeania hirsuta]